ncbi:hypothetical protein BH23PLA1_BH23PLA1_36190 [soil metagenome]
MRTKSKRELYSAAITAVEKKILDAMPEITDGLIKRASEGDAKAASYLMDRILGTVAKTRYAPAEDHRELANEPSPLLNQFLGRSGANGGG